VAKERLGPVVDLRGVADDGRLGNAAARLLPHPAGKRSCGFANVALGEMAGAQGKELEELSGEVLVGFLLLAGPAVEPDEHCRIGDHGFE
jgi:hypothetical protein